jgi:phosphoribosylformimino-5-aminoimidazole carboxamide ribotide isomerase
MLIIPAIDILEGKCVRLRQGRFDEVSVFSEDPGTMARHWVKAGAKLLHVVDLAGARDGHPQCLDHLRVISQIGVPVQIGGGLRTLEDIEAALEAGAARVVIGSRLVNDLDFAKEVFRNFGDRIVAGIDARGGVVAIHGWQDLDPERTSALALAQQMENLGAKRIIYTDIARDGMLAGPNILSLKEMLAAVKIPVIASGGVTTLEDVRQLKITTVEGCIVGRALYTKDLELEAAIRSAEA